MSQNQKCNLCQNRGIIVKDGIGYRCQCMRQKALSNRFQYANLGGLLRNHTFDKFSLDYYPKDKTPASDINLTYFESARRAYQAAKEFTEEFSKGNYRGQGLLFSGSVGSGKTFLAGAIANTVLSYGHQVLFTVVPDLLDEIKATYSRTGDSDVDELTLLESARNVELLILDDLGVHNYTDWTVNKIYSILNYRANHQLPIIITTNHDLEELEAYLGERTTSRILQLCKIYRLSVDQDIRFTISQKKGARFS
ncbi:MAG TPA: ATP-binding protein [Clostridia bacterium]|nr:ATP-binding protein [Clostridia bacterium]